MSRRGAWTRRQTLPPHAIAFRQQRGQQLAGQRGRKSRDQIPAPRRPASVLAPAGDDAEQEAD